MTNAAEFQAAFPEPQSILGLRLLPLSLGRYRILMRLQSPFVDDQEQSVPPTADAVKDITGDLFLALAVCGLPCREFVALFNDGKLAEELRQWGEQIRKITEQENFHIFEPVTRFKNFLAESSKIPWVVLNEHNDASGTLAHWSTAMETMLRAKLHWSAEEIEERPLSEALTQFFKFLESEGIVRLYDESTYAALQVEARANGEALEKIMKERDGLKT